MPAPLMRHNPAFLTPDQLDEGFVVRLRDLEFVVDAIRENTDRPANQHLLVIGARGMGKTSLVLRAANAVRADPALSARWYPIVWGEEAYQVGTAGEFWLEALLHLGDQTGDARWIGAREELLDEPDEERLATRAMARLMEFADEQGRRLLIVVENLQMILGEQMDRDAAWALRHALMNEPRLMLLATSTLRFKQIASRQEALYEMFLEHRLDPLTQPECRLLWERVSGQPLSAARARPIEILTGGNTRLLTILASFAEGRSFRELMTDLVQLVDEHTDYFKSNFEALSSTERRVFSALADLWRPAKASEVARQARVKVNEASRDLGRMESRGPVTVVGERGRAKLYQLTERLYNLYHLLRRRGSPAQRVKSAVEFIVHLYPDDEVKPVLTGIAAEALSMPCGESQDHLWAIAGILDKQEPDRRLRAIRELPKEIWRLEGLPRRMWEFAAEDDELLEEQFPLVFEALSRVANLEGSWSPFIEFCEEVGGELEQQIARFMSVPDNDIPWMIGVFQRCARDEDIAALQIVHDAVRAVPGSATLWGLMATTLSWQAGNEQEIEQALRRVVELRPEDPEAWERLARHRVEELKDPASAIAALAKAVQLDPNNLDYLLRLVRLHISVEERDAAVAALEQGRSVVREDDCRGLSNMAVLYTDLGKPDQAVALALRLVALEPSEAANLSLLGESLLLDHKPGDALEALKGAQTLPSLNEAIADQIRVNMSVALLSLERYQEALEVANSIIAGGRDIWQARINCASALQLLGRESEAGDVLEATVARHPEVGPVLYEYAKFLDTVQSDLAGAERILQQLVALGPGGYHRALLPLFGVLLRRGRPAEAVDLVAAFEGRRSPELLNGLAWLACLRTTNPDALLAAREWAREAVKLSPDNRAFRHTFASLLGATGDWKNALAESARFLDDPDWSKGCLEDITDFFIEATAADQAEAALTVLEASPTAALTEPLVLALQRLAGQSPLAPQEIAAVADDVLKRIEARRAARAAGLPWARLLDESESGQEQEEKSSS